MALSVQKTYSLSGVWSVTMEDGEVLNMRIPGTLAENGIGTSDAPVSDALLTMGKDPLEEAEEMPEEAVLETRLTQRFAYEGVVRLSRMLSFLELPEKRYFLEVERARDLKLLIDEVPVPLFQPACLGSPWIFEVTGLLNGSHMVTMVSDNRLENLPKAEILASNMASPDTQTNWNGLLGAVRIREEASCFIRDIRVSYQKERAAVEVTIFAAEPVEGLLTVECSAFRTVYTKELSMESPVEVVRFEDILLAEDAPLWDEGEGNLVDIRVSFQIDTKTLRTGFRSLESREGRFVLNDRPVFLKGETNEAVFPDADHPPMDSAAWNQYFKLIQSYGLNAVYFRGWCPPEAAFSAADELGMMLFSELSLCAPSEDPYYIFEARLLKEAYGSHPSFFGLLSGNGQFGDVQPVLDLGQHDMLPDFREIDMFSGPLSPDHLVRMREVVFKERLLAVWDKAMSSAVQEGARQYRKDIEALLLRPDCPGFFLSGLQDMPGKGLHPHGLADAHLVPKRAEAASPLAFCQVVAPVRALLQTDSFSLAIGQPFTGEVWVRNDEKNHVTTKITWTLTGDDFRKTGELSQRVCRRSQLTSFGTLEIPLSEEELPNLPAALKLTLRTERGSVSYRFYVYENRIPVCPENVYETDVLDETALAFLREGGNVFLTPPVGEESVESGLLVVDDKHPLIRALPFGSGDFGALDRLLTGAPVRFKRRHRTLIHNWDLQDFATPTGFLAEFRVLNGHVLLSTLGLKEKMQYPEAREFIDAIYSYMDSFDFSPREEMLPEELNRAIQKMKEVRRGR